MLNGTNRWRLIFLLGIGILIVLYLTGRYLTEPEVRLFALDAETGRVQWSTGLGNHRVSNPVFANGRVFVDVGSYDEDPDKFWELSAFKADTGARLWTFPGSAEDPIIARSKPVAVGDIVVDDLDYDTLGVFDAATGALLQTVDDAFTGYAGRDLAVALAGDRLIVLQQKKADAAWVNSVLAFQATAGSLLWRTDCSGRCDGQQMVNKESDQPVVVDGQSIFVTAPEQVDVYELDSGKYQFSLDGDCNHIEPAGPIFYCQEGLSLRAIDAATGDALWEFSAPDPDLPFLIGLQTDDQALYVRNVRDRDPSGMTLFALDPANGQVRWEKQLWDQTGDSRYLRVLSASASSKSVFEVSILNGQAMLVALSAVDGGTQWQFPVWGGSYSPAYADGYLFMLDRAPRLRNWLAHLNPAWHAGTADGL